MSAVKYVGDEFISQYIYPFFSAKDDAEMLTQMVWIGFFYTLSVIFSMLVFPAPYGMLYNLLPIILSVLKHLVFGRSIQQCQFWIPCAVQVCLDYTRITILHNTTHNVVHHCLSLLDHFFSQQNSCGFNHHTLRAEEFNLPAYQQGSETYTPGSLPVSYGIYLL